MHPPTGVEPYLNEFMNFPNGANDDQVDSLVQLLHWNYPSGLLPAPSARQDFGARMPDLQRKSQ